MPGLGSVVLYLLITAGPGQSWSQYESKRFDTIAECKALGRQIVGQNFHIIKYLCQGPAEVQAEFFSVPK
jgi:hypothetical protein